MDGSKKIKLIYALPKITSIAYIIAGNAGTHANAPQKTQPSNQRINVIQNLVLISPWCRYTARGGNKMASINKRKVFVSVS